MSRGQPPRRPTGAGRPLARPIVEVDVTGLASGGDGVGRDPGGRVVFVPLTAPGDRVRVQLVEEKPSFARGEIIQILVAGKDRVEPACPEVSRGCGGCQWQQVVRAEQLRAKQMIVANALRRLTMLTLHPIADPCPALGWRRRARFHVEGGKVGLYIRSSNRVLPFGHCPQLEPALDAAFAVVAATVPPDGELEMLRGHDGRIVIATEQMWPAAGQLIGQAGIVGAVTGQAVWGDWLIEAEPGVATGPRDFAQASAAGNGALIAKTRAALGRPAVRAATEELVIPAQPEPARASRARRNTYENLIAKIHVDPARRPFTGTRPERTVVELYAGNGNFTRAFAADGWEVIASDIVAPHLTSPGVRFEVGSAPEVLARLEGPVAAVVLDPPRAGALDAIEGILRLSPTRIIYVSCDPATLARDTAKLVEGGYRATDAWPIDLMPQTSHVEVVLRFVREDRV